MNSPENGICHWDAKRVSLKAIFSASTDVEVIKKVVPEHSSKEEEIEYDILVRRISQMYRQWGKRTPKKSTDGPKLFFDSLAEFCRYGSNATGQTLIDDDIGAFLASFKEEDRKIALASLNDAGKRHGLTVQEQMEVNLRFGYMPDSENAEVARATGHLNNHFPVFHSTHDTMQTVRMAIEAGMLSSDRFYLSPDAAASWLDLIDSPDYPSYQHCLQGLQELIDRQAWRNIIGAGSHSRVVMLGGGGAPSKDLLLVENILSLLPEKRRPLRYVLVDLSTPLLIDSTRFLLREMVRHGWTNKMLEIIPIAHDFLKLRGCAELLDSSGNSVWACTAGTIGNVRENQFFNSLNTRATTGDILLLTADTFNGESLNDFRETIRGKYKHDAMRKFLSFPLGTVLQLENSTEPIVSALRRIEIKVDNDEDFEHSDIVGSRYVEFSILLKNHLKPLILLNSTRYNEQCLLDHARGYGWRHIDTATSTKNKCFKQFLFRRS